jgi:hypothetical protein
MPSPLSWLLSWLLNEVAGCGDAGIEPPSFNFAITVVAGGYPSRVLCLPAIVYNYITYLVRRYLSFQWLRVYCRSDGRPPKSHDTLRVMIPSARGKYVSSLMLT